MSWHWPLLHDTTVIQSVSFLIDKGWAPYRQIGDMNMPGAYLFEGWALHLFGSSDMWWRLYDFSLSAFMMMAMISIGRRYDWLAGFVANGHRLAVQREFGGSVPTLHPGQNSNVQAYRILVRRDVEVPPGTFK